MIKTIIIDDEPIAIEIISDFLEEFDDIELLGTFRSPVDALNSSLLNKVDLIFLDIKMPKLTGLELLKSTNASPMVIFTTAYENYALDSFEFRTIDYLVKPIAFSRFAKAIQKVRSVTTEKTNSMSKQMFIFKDGKQSFRIPYSEILYLKSEGDYIHIHTKSARHLTYNRISKLETEFAPFGFERCHLSYLVNMQLVDIFESKKLRIGELSVPISRTYKDRIRNWLICSK